MQTCPYCKSTHFKKHGWFIRQQTRSRVRRFYCNDCLKTFSSRTTALDRYQKKPHLNGLIARMLCNRGTLRGIGDSLNISYSTVYRKFLWLGEVNKDPKILKRSKALWFDEMETFEHTKLKPLTIAIVVDQDYRIHQAVVGTIPSKGHLARLSIKKYGFRPDQSKWVTDRALSNVSQYARAEVIYTDQKHSYCKIIKKHFKGTLHKQCRPIKKSVEERYGSIKMFDSLFPVNQRSGQLREKISRLTRRSWITTKKIENLQKHLDIFIAYNNGRLIS